MGFVQVQLGLARSICKTHTFKIGSEKLRQLLVPPLTEFLSHFSLQHLVLDLFYRQITTYYERSL